MTQTELLYKAPVGPHFRINEDTTHYNRKMSSTRLLKRVPLNKLMDLKIDYSFKQLFGSEKNKHITVVFLNAFLQKAGRGKIKEIAFLNSEIGREYAEDKLSRLDVLVTTNQNERINMEIQFSNKYNMIKRSLFYWSRLYAETLNKSMDYDELRTVISINILNYNIFDQTERFHTMYHLHEDKDKFRLTNVMEFHFIEMPKLLKDWKKEQLDPWNDILVRWLLLLGIVDHRNGEVYEDIYKELEAIAVNDKTLHSAFEGWENLSLAESEVRAYEDRLKRILDEEAYQAKMDKLKQKIMEGEQRNKEESQRIEEESQRIEEESQRIEEENQRIEEENQRIEEESQRIEEEKQRLMQREKSIERKEKMAEHKIKEAKQKEQEAVQIAKEEVAIRLLKAGVETDLIVESTGLTKEQVAEIQRDMKK
ncbi:Rpn family recombination-promoting nuclease/putative transposase [Lederbergia sp. NSJ-179]|uniref:Rpn family recombination-promoting nuclease/putative transposase n=1 Tax=Lederbergia sp. NSJ-179 TaxID=2931402 RepID=UPI001FD4F466|nr:Rpn family recombination-promoting nuclease/putative transposase [Lederbergia sp. NSJ-179]MCJ7841464.1 Rpn family recombination-promoting nuclease/putative transposase [Lederbergia sp. NSJ-179]